MVFLAYLGTGLLKFVLGMGVLVFGILTISKLIHGISSACLLTDQAFRIWREQLGTGPAGNLTEGEIQRTIIKINHLIGEYKGDPESPTADQ